MRRPSPGFTLVELMIVIVIIGILASLAIPSFTRMRNRAKDASVRSNAHTVQIAAEDFAVQNDGTYATDDSTLLPSGQSISDLVPRVENPYGGAAAIVWIGAATASGEVGYDTTGVVGEGYTIDGQGADGEIVITLTNGG